MKKKICGAGPRWRRRLTKMFIHWLSYPLGVHSVAIKARVPTDNSNMPDNNPLEATLFD